MSKENDPSDALDKLGSMFDDLQAEADAELRKAADELKSIGAAPEAAAAAAPQARASENAGSEDVRGDVVLAGQLYGKISGAGMYNRERQGYIRGNPSFPKLITLRDRYHARGRQAAENDEIREHYPRIPTQGGQPEQVRNGLVVLRDAYADGVLDRWREEENFTEFGTTEAMRDLVRQEKTKRRARRSVSPGNAEDDEIPSADCLMWEALEHKLELHAMHSMSPDSPEYREAQQDYDELTRLLAARYGAAVRASDNAAERPAPGGAETGSVGPSPVRTAPARDPAPRPEKPAPEPARSFIRRILDLLPKPPPPRIRVAGTIASKNAPEESSPNEGASPHDADPDRET